MAGPWQLASGDVGIPNAKQLGSGTDIDWPAERRASCYTCPTCVSCVPCVRWTIAVQIRRAPAPGGYKMALSAPTPLFNSC